MKTAVVVKRRTPEHRAVRHHAARHVLRLNVVTGRTRASFRDDAQIAGIDKPHKLPTLSRQECVGPFRIRATVFPRTSPLAWEHRLHMRILFDARNGIAAVTRSTTQPHRIFSIFQLLERLRRAILVHRLNETVTRNTPFEFHSRGLNGRRRGPRRDDSNEKTYQADG